MDLDLLDESYTIVNPKLTFEDFDLDSLTGYAIPVRLPTQSCQFLVSTHTNKKMLLATCRLRRRILIFRSRVGRSGFVTRVGH
jgi:hypothetical protein